MAPDVGDYFPIPRYDDYQGIRPRWRCAATRSSTAMLLASDDALTRTLPAPDPARGAHREPRLDLLSRLAPLLAILPDGSSVEVTPSFGFDTSSSITKFGAGADDHGLDGVALRIARAYRRKRGVVRHDVAWASTCRARSRTRCARARSTFRRAKATSSSSAVRPATTSTPTTGAITSSTSGPTSSPNCTAGNSRSCRACASTAFMLEGSALKPAVVGIAPHRLLAARLGRGPAPLGQLSRRSSA